MYKVMCTNMWAACGLGIGKDIYYAGLCNSPDLYTAFAQACTAYCTYLYHVVKMFFQSVVLSLCTVYPGLINTTITILINLNIIINRWDNFKFLSIILRDKRELV